MANENTYDMAHSNTQEKILALKKGTKGLKNIIKKAFVPMLFLGVMAIYKFEVIAVSKPNSKDTSVIEAQAKVNDNEDATNKKDFKYPVGSLLKRHYFDHLSFIHYRQALLEIDIMDKRVQNEHVSGLDNEMMNIEMEEKLEKALDCLMRNKGICVMVACGWWRKEISPKPIIDEIVLLITQYGATEGSQVKYKEIVPFIPTKKPKQSARHMQAINYDVIGEWLAAAKAGDKKKIIELHAVYGDNLMIWADTTNYKTALILAAWNGHLACVKWLCEQGANKEAKDKDGDTALMRAAYYGYVECVKALCVKGAGVNVKNEYGDTALMNAADKGHLECLKALCEKGANVNATDKDGCTALMIAAYYGHLECLKALCKNEADVNAKNKNGCTALIEAAKKGKSACVKALCVNGADVNAKDKDGHNALYHATSSECSRCVKYLTSFISL